MGTRQLEAAILAELREVVGKRSIRQRDILEWRSGRELTDPVATHKGEQYAYLPTLGIAVCYQGKVKK